MAEQRDKPTGPTSRPLAGQSLEAQTSGTEEWLLTYDTSTGALTKIARLDSTGKRQELSEEEYAAMWGFDPAEYPAYADYPVDTSDAYTSNYAASVHDPYGYEQGYWAGWADYEAAANGGGYYATPEEAAYYQGMMDYMATVG